MYAGATRGRAPRLVAAGIAFFVFASAGTASAGKGGKPRPDTSPPSVAVSSPFAGATMRGTVTVSGTATDNVQVASVAVSVDGGAYATAQGTTSWSFGLDTRLFADGTHTVMARARDASGNASTASVSFTVSNADTTPPAVSIAAPAAGATVGGAISVSGNASDSGGVASVAVSVDGGSYTPATGTASWSESLDTSALSNGPHTITARALDTSGNASTANVGVTVRNADTTAPTVQIASPAAGATLTGTVTVSGSSSDNAQVASVAVAVDGGPFSAAQGTTAWSYSLATGSLSNGAHTIRVRASDGSGNVTTASVAVTVQNGLPPGVAEQLVTPEGVTIQVSTGVTGWTAQQVYDLLKANALELVRIGPSLTVKVQTTYASSSSVGVSQTNGVYGNFHGTIYLDAASGTVFPVRPDDVMAHEYGCVWGLYHLYMSHHGDWSLWLQARGILGDPRVDSTFSWSKNEMLADDYRMLFGTPAAQSEAAYINPDVPDPRTVAGLRDFFLDTWALP